MKILIFKLEIAAVSLAEAGDKKAAYWDKFV
jgi:hypothetical protein